MSIIPSVLMRVRLLNTPSNKHILKFVHTVYFQSYVDPHHIPDTRRADSSYGLITTSHLVFQHLC